MNDAVRLRRRVSSSGRSIWAAGHLLALNLVAFVCEEEKEIDVGASEKWRGEHDFCNPRSGICHRTVHLLGSIHNIVSNSDSSCNGSPYHGVPPTVPLSKTLLR